MMRNIFLALLFILPVFCFGQQDSDFFNQFKAESKSFDKSRIDYYLNSGDLNPDDFEGYFKRGILNMENGLYEEAIKNFRYLIHEQPDIVAAEPESALPYSYIAQCKMSLGAYDSVIYFYNKVLDLEPANVEAYNGRGIAQVGMGNFEEALSDFEKTMFYDKKYYYGLYNIGRTKYLMGKKTEAITDLKKAGRKLPDFEKPYMLIGEIYLEEGQPGNARPFFHKALIRNPNSATASYFMGYCALLYGIKTYYPSIIKDSRDDFAKAYRLDETFVDAYKKAALVDMWFEQYDSVIREEYLAMKYGIAKPGPGKTLGPADLEKWYILQAVNEGEGISHKEKRIGRDYLTCVYNDSTEQIYNKAAAYALEHPQSMFIHRILLYEKLRKEETAGINIFVDKILGLDSSLVHIKAINADILCSRGRYSRGIAQIKHLIDEQKDYLYLYSLLGEKYEEIGRYDSAIAVLDRVLKTTPNYIYILLQRADVLNKQGNHTEALNDVNKYLETSPGVSRAWLIKGETFNLLEEPDSALVALDACLEISPHYVAPYQEKAKSYLMKDNPDEAWKVYQALIDKYYHSYVGYFYRAEFHLNQMKNMERALKDYNIALAINPENARVLEAIGDLYLYHKKDYEAAKEHYQKCLEIDENRASSLNRMGECYYNQEDYSTAMEYFKRAMETDSLNVRLLSNMGSTCLKLNDYRNALNFYEKQSGIEPVSGTSLGNTGWCYYLLGEYDKCIEYSQQAIETDSATYFAMANIALTHLRMGETELASKEYADYIGRAGADEDYDHSEAIGDLQGLVDEGIMVAEARNILSKYFGVEE